MNADILEKISYISFFAAALFLMLAIILFFRFHIYALMDDLSGKKAKRQIQAYRENNMGLKLQENVGSEYLGYYRQAAETALLDGQTAVLTDEATVALNERHEAGEAAYAVVLDEIAVHTGERIS